MILEARAENCCSMTFILKRDGLSHGTFSGHWLSESLDVQCMGRQRLRFRNVRWLWSEFVLEEAESGELMGRAVRGGVFTRSWDLELAAGTAVLAAAGLFSTAYELRQDNEVKARVDRLGLCDRGWRVQEWDGLADTDLILVGLVYHTVQERERRQQAHAGAHGS